MKSLINDLYKKKCSGEKIRIHYIRAYGKMLKCLSRMLKFGKIYQVSDATLDKLLVEIE